MVTGWVGRWPAKIRGGIVESTEELRAGGCVEGAQEVQDKVLLGWVSPPIFNKNRSPVISALIVRAVNEAALDPQERRLLNRAKANSSILNALLMILNERCFDNGDQRVPMQDRRARSFQFEECCFFHGR